MRDLVVPDVGMFLVAVVETHDGAQLSGSSFRL